MNTTSVILTSILTAHLASAEPSGSSAPSNLHHRQGRIRGQGAMCRLNIHHRPPRTNCRWASLTTSGSPAELLACAA